MTRIGAAAAWMLLTCGMATADVPLQDFADLSAWTLNRDGGRDVERGAATLAGGARGMRLRYTDGPPHWGNLTAPCRVPGEATAIRFAIVKHASDPAAAMYVWLMEPDGDAWAQQVTARGLAVGQWSPGRHEVSLPMSGFRFEHRGPGTRAMVSCDRMLLGCNYGDLEVTVEPMRWTTRAGHGGAPLPRMEGLAVERGERGSVAVLDMAPGLPDGFRTAHAPQALARVLRRGGFGVTVLRPGDLADPSVLTVANYGAVVLPFGPYFPRAARETFVAYLRAGGGFLSTDGYAFDRLVEWTGAGWEDAGAGATAADMASPSADSAPMNTRAGRSGDAVTFAPEQIGVFDPADPLTGAAHGRPSAWLSATAAGQALPRYRFARPPTGFAASGLIGDNSPVFPPVYRRWIPLVEAFSPSGEVRGALLSLMRNHAGTYAGSAWAFSGITSGDDVFLGTSARRALLCRVVGELVDRVGLRDLRTDLATYRVGKKARVRVTATRHGAGPVTATLRLSVGGRWLPERRVALSPGAARTVEVVVPVTAAMGDLVPVRAVLDVVGRARDTLDSAFCVWSPKVVASGPRIEWRDNHLWVNGRPRFLAGTNQTGMMFYSAHEGPLVWDRDLRMMAERGVRVLRILHFSPFAKAGYEGDGANAPLDLATRPARLRRQLDAIVQLAQKHGVCLFLSLHDWMGVALTDEELAAQADWNRFWAARYRDVPAILYDVQNEPSVEVPDRPDMRRLWNEWLKAHYRTDEALRSAWRVTPPEAPMPGVPLAGGTSRWDDVRSADRKRFEAVILNRWVKANVDGVKAGDADAPVCVGYLPFMSAADRILGTRHTDFSNMHYYGPLEGYAAELKLIDRRAYGKGLSIGEFGAQEAHDSRAQGLTGLPVEASVRRFSQVVHYAAGMGAAFVANWDWKEFDEMVFPWGLLQRGTGTAKPWLHTFAQEAAYLAGVEPSGALPAVALLVPDSNRIGPRFDEIHGGIRRAAGLLMDAGADFCVLNEEDLARIPTAVRAIVWPVPYCPSDAAFERVLAWVRNGGRLYLSGGVSFDAARRPDRTGRLRELGLPESEPRPPFDGAPADGPSVAVREATVGAGAVFYVPYPLELVREGGADIYRRFLKGAGIGEPIARAEGGTVRVLTEPTRSGGRLVALVRTDRGDGRVRMTLPHCDAALDLGPGGAAFVTVDDRNRLVAAESDGRLEVGGRVLAAAAGHFGVVALDGRALAESAHVLVLPHLQSRVSVPGLRGVAGGQAAVRRYGEPWRAAQAGAVLRCEPGETLLLAARGGMRAAREAMRRRDALAP